MVELSGHPFLVQVESGLREAVKLLSSRFDSVSLLAADAFGGTYRRDSMSMSFRDSRWGERSAVVRASRAGVIAEYSFLFDSDRFDPVERAGYIARQLEILLQFPGPSLLSDGDVPAAGTNTHGDGIFSHSVDRDPETVPADVIFAKLGDMHDRIRSGDPNIVNCNARYEWLKKSQVFITPDAVRHQNLVWSEADVTVFARTGDKNYLNYIAEAGSVGTELLDTIESQIPALLKELGEIGSAQRVSPGTYDIITSPVVSGLLAHEAFGHGVEMDLFVRNRALAQKYIGKRVASDLVSMVDEGHVPGQIVNFSFDDEGNPPRTNVIIKNGILMKGLADSLSARALGVPPTGNGRRETLLRKSYSRMTNTVFTGGPHSLEEMIASIDNGFLIDKMLSGMEDPRNWGLQAMVLIGREIKNGKLTGKVFSPLILTGYVPDILGDVTMVSNEVELNGAGYCGKGHREMVKVSLGGPYMKTRMRIG